MMTWVLFGAVWFLFGAVSRTFRGRSRRDHVPRLWPIAVRDVGTREVRYELGKSRTVQPIAADLSDFPERIRQRLAQQKETHTP